jgi:hypothetical protein
MGYRFVILILSSFRMLKSVTCGTKTSEVFATYGALRGDFGSPGRGIALTMCHGYLSPR